jgi:hypothetical protein
MKNEIPFITKWALLFRNQKYPRIYRQKINLHGKRFVLINEISKIPPEERKNYILCYGEPQKVMENDVSKGLVKRVPHRFELLKLEYAEKSGQYSFLDALLSA